MDWVGDGGEDSIVDWIIVPTLCSPLPSSNEIITIHSHPLPNSFVVPSHCAFLDSGLWLFD